VLLETDEEKIGKVDSWFTLAHRMLRLYPSPSENHLRLKDMIMQDATSWAVVAALVLTITIPLAFSPPSAANAGTLADFSDSAIQSMQYFFVFCFGLGSLLLCLSITLATDRFQNILILPAQKIPLFLQLQPRVTPWGPPMYGFYVMGLTRVAFGLFVSGTCAGVFLAHGFVPCLVAAGVVAVFYTPVSIVWAVEHMRVRGILCNVGPDSSQRRVAPQPELPAAMRSPETSSPGRVTVFPSPSSSPAT
jgi:hypothetical protein